MIGYSAFSVDEFVSLARHLASEKGVDLDSLLREYYDNADPEWEDMTDFSAIHYALVKLGYEFVVSVA